MKFLLLIFFQLIVFTSFSQNKAQKVILFSTKTELDSLAKAFNKLNVDLKSLRTELSGLKHENEKHIKSHELINNKVDSLKIANFSNSTSIKNNYSTLNDSINNKSEKTNNDFGNVRTTINSNIQYGIISILTLLLISFIAYWLINRFRLADKSELSNKLDNTRLSLEEGLILEFNKQAILMDKELAAITNQTQSVQQAPEIKLDHSLALKVASEINLIERNVRLMDPKAKGLKQVVASVGKLRDNLAANGYEIPELLGKPFNKGMNVIVAMSIIDDTLLAGQEIISRILIPQVNYDNKMILTAQIEVSVANS